MPGKNIKIEIWTDLYYAKFIAIWRPEEEPDYIPLVPDTRPEQSRNVPVLLIIDGMYEGRVEVVGANPVAPSQHPMPPDFMKRYVRHISYCFANDFCTFRPPTKSAAQTFLAKVRLGYTLSKEMNVVVSSAYGNITLKEFKDSLGIYTDDELKNIKVRTLGEHPDDVYTADLGSYVHMPKGQNINRYITVTQLLNVYSIDDTSINNSQLNNDIIATGQPPGTTNSSIAKGQASLTMNAIANNSADATIMDAAAKITVNNAIVNSTSVTTLPPLVTRDEAQQQAIKDLLSSTVNTK